ncbi:HD-GYP domain (HD superfamily hydrolase) [hydrothermal vent metagenome]|uniref:HD-GYP domain (HD superfamily hydrolase) n=1 Tax=hydrothermal vent metagenome TaxID=652676 RepID=A0A3B0ZJ95_9ZZZZ
MSEIIEQEFLNALLTDLENGKLVLPTLPEVALKVRDTLEDDDVSMNKVNEVISSDAALSARLIQVANSPLLRAAQPIDSLLGAISRMGFTMVKNLVTSMVMEQMFQATSDITDSRLRAIWEHSTQVAAISHALCAEMTKLPADQAMLAGLVHDIGVLPILSRVEEIPELLDDEAKLDSIIRKAHGEIGAAILKKWHFSDQLIAVAAEHENLTRDHDGPADYIDIITVANLQSHFGTEHYLTKEDWTKIPAFAKLGLEPEMNLVDLEHVEEKMDAVKIALNG